MDRRRFVRFAAAAALAPVSGCLGGSGETNTDGADNGGDEADLADFGYKTWVPSGSYTKIAYADLARLREWDTLEIDDETATLAGSAGPKFADVDGYISTDTENAYSGSFDAEALASAVSEALSSPEESEYKGYTVVRGGGEGGDIVEVVLSDSFAVSSTQGEGGATGYVDAALGETERAAEVSPPMQDLSKYVSDPLLVVLTPNPRGVGVVMYRYIEAREKRLDYVEVTLPILNKKKRRQRFLNQSPRRKYNESTLGPDARNTTARIQNSTGILSSPVDDIDFLLRDFFIESGSSSTKST